MNRITLAAVALATLGLAAPAVADLQLARSLRVEPGALAADELARLHFATRSDHE